MKTNKEKPVTFREDVDMLKDLDKIAETLNMDRSTFIRCAIRREVALLKYESRKTKETKAK